MERRLGSHSNSLMSSHSRVPFQYQSMSKKGSFIVDDDKNSGKHARIEAASQVLHEIVGLLRNEGRKGPLWAPLIYQVEEKEEVEVVV